MNTIRSVGYGWGVLVLAGGGAYYFAKRSIASDREARAQTELERRQRQEQMRRQERLLQASPSYAKPPMTRNGEHSGNPSYEASQDPAPISHAPSTEGERLKDKSKYEASEPWRSRKGDRFS
ncbi:hypothetical protein NA57DRAFT_78932 [Rhizodiscina lignyota]|uniref:Uncharacterized protein n=1 Tax=Rhizodiscina lignyota TaxID=1504668 RepID=A0A9P4M6B9_9PEZI|nr:hypothetical protein NA57DRAFT_78932 [Rhizodiscina lignyota]